MEHSEKPVIYKIINLTNAKFYVGSTVKWRTRVRTHRRKLAAGTHHCLPLQNAWNKYGADSFVFRIVVTVDDPAELHSVEQVFLNEHHGTNQCYNMARHTDNSSRGAVRSDRHKERISAALKRHYEENTHPRLGLPHSEKSKARMRTNRAGKVVSEDTKAKLREANLGKRATAETRAKLSAIRKGKERAAEHAAKYNKAIVEVTSGQVFQSLKEVKAAFGLSPGMLAKALAADRPLIRGKNAGKHFRYAAPNRLD
jgi:group I intron endonuclease